MGIDSCDKVIVFSDALDKDKALGLKKQCDEIGFKGVDVYSPLSPNLTI